MEEDRVQISIDRSEYDLIGKLISIMTDGIYYKIEDGEENIVREFRFRYADIAELALNLEDVLDELFENCTTVGDCKEKLEEYFEWEVYK